jgi:hypothetical protein
MLNIPSKGMALAALAVLLAPIAALAVDVDMDAGT